MADKFETGNKNKDMGRVVEAAMIAKKDVPVNDKKQLMETIYNGNMEAVQKGLDSDVLNKGSLQEKRNFFENVASANLYGKQLAGANEKAYKVPDIEVDDVTGKISLTLQDYTPPTMSYEMGSMQDKKTARAMDDVMSKNEQNVHKSIRDVNSYVDLKQDGSAKDAARKTVGLSRGFGSVVKDVGLGAATGAGFGTIVPGVGTAIGAGVGAAMGGVGGIAHTVRHSMIESRQSAGEQAASKAIRADAKEVKHSSRQDRIAQAEAISGNIQSGNDGKSAGVEF